MTTPAGDPWKSPVEALPKVDIFDQGDLVIWGAARQDAHPVDPYRAGHCVIRRTYSPDSKGQGPGQIEVMSSTPETLISDEALHEVARGQSHPDITLTGPVSELLQVEQQVDLIRLQVDERARPELDERSGWVPPCQRSHHVAHRCDALDVCYHGHLLRIAGINQTVIYRIGHHRLLLNCWEGQWAD